MVIARQPISNHNWDAGLMLRKALRGAYPSAKYDAETRPAEIAYWRSRCQAEGVDHKRIEADYEAERRRKARRGR